MKEQNSEREAAIRRLKEKRDFRMHFGAYIIITTMLILIWATTGHGSFWPIWVILFWGVGLAFHGWYAFFGSSFSEAEIRCEMGKTD